MSFLRVLFIGTGVGSLTGLQRSSDLCPWQAAEGGNRPFFSRARTFSWLAPCIAIAARSVSSVTPRSFAASGLILSSIDSLFFCKSVRSGLVKYGVFQVHILDHGLVVMKVPFRLQLEKLLHRVSTPPMCHNANRKRCATPMSELCDPLHLRNPSLSTFLGAPS